EVRRPHYPTTTEQQREIITTFDKTTVDGDLNTLVTALHPDVVFTIDNNNKAITTRKPLEGADRVARALKALAAKGGTGVDFDLVNINRIPNMLGVSDDAATLVSFTIDDGLIVAIDVIRNPDKLRRLP